MWKELSNFRCLYIFCCSVWSAARLGLVFTSLMCDPRRSMSGTVTYHARGFPLTHGRSVVLYHQAHWLLHCLNLANSSSSYYYCCYYHHY